MAKELKDLTKRSVDYSRWYNELVVKADLAEQSEKPDAARVFDSDDSMGHTSKKMIEAYERNMK